MRTLASKLMLCFAPALLLAAAAVPAHAQNRGDHRDFYNGMRDGGRGGQYQGHGHNDDHYGRNDNYDRNRQPGGIGPGKGALIGAAGGAALGAIFGHGVKSTIIGGAAGAGIGAVVGQAHQNSVRNRDGYYR